VATGSASKRRDAGVFVMVIEPVQGAAMSKIGYVVMVRGYA